MQHAVDAALECLRCSMHAGATLDSVAPKSVVATQANSSAAILTVAIPSAAILWVQGILRLCASQGVLCPAAVQGTEGAIGSC